MSYLTTRDLAFAQSFRTRVMVAIVDIAGDVLGEAQGSMTAIHYQKRSDLARNALRDPEPIVSAFIWPVLSNSVIANSGLDTPDGDLAFQVSAVWDAVAGVSAADKTG